MYDMCSYLLRKIYGPMDYLCEIRQMIPRFLINIVFLNIPFRFAGSNLKTRVCGVSDSAHEGT